MEKDYSIFSENETGKIKESHSSLRSSLRKWRSEWLEIFPWLQEREGKSFCKACGRTLHNNLTHLTRHDHNTNHIRNYDAQKKQIQITSFLSEKERSFREDVKRAEYTLVMFCLIHHLSFLLMDSLPALLRECCPDSAIAKAVQCGRTKATQITKFLGDSGQERVCTDLRRTKFSLIVDESTDVTCTKALVLVCRYFDRTLFKVCDRFLGLLHLEKTDAEAIFQVIKEFFEKHQIPLKNLIGLATDGASVMAGQLNGLQAKIKNLNPYVFYQKCICHSLHLCASYATKCLPVLTEQLCRDIFNFFAHSPKRISEFKEFQEYVELKSHKILGLSQTRWLSLESVVNRILEQWDALKLYFISNVLESKGILSTDLAQNMDKPKNKFYFLFLSYILKIINNLNTEFQSENLRLPYIYTIMDSTFKSIASNFMTSEYIRLCANSNAINIFDENHYIPTKNIYVGARVELLLKESNLSESEIIELKHTVLYFYLELLMQIKKRFDFNDANLRLLHLIHPENALSTSESILPLINNFSHLIKDESIIETISTQWRLLKALNITNLSTDNIEIFWKNVYEMKNGLGEPQFKELSEFVFDLMSLPHSSAAAERVFSDMNLIKNKLTNRLHLSTIQNIMSAKELLGPNKNINVWSAKDL